MKIFKYISIGLIILVLVVGLAMYLFPGFQTLIYPRLTQYKSPVLKIPIAERNAADWIVIGAKEEVLKRVKYDASYQKIDYPMGDVNPEVGACTDVVIRALRKAGYDLQQLIHEDMVNNFDQYPTRWGLKVPDPNIDHRRVPNQRVYFAHYGRELPIEYNEDTKDNWQPGDIVYWEMPTGADHTGIISDRKNRHGVPLVIHNAFRTVEDDALLRWEIIGHVRYPIE